MSTTVPQFEHWIDGHPVPPASGRHLDSTSPHDGELVSRIADGSAEDVERAVTAAHRAQPAWGRTTTTERSRVLTSIAAGIHESAANCPCPPAWNCSSPPTTSSTTAPSCAPSPATRSTRARGT